MSRPDGDGEEPPLLPDRTRDESDEGWSEREEPSDDRRLVEERPPHHDRWD